ncbi:hypothetical protein GCM10022233_87470 [Streptomyces shaanxiensis]|uniref:Uncharacterized protein n=1 Tax=Streptomyces shaanxiensis TaxID=653357 RepID=A0ABP7WKG3_9ACTN
MAVPRSLNPLNVRALHVGLLWGLHDARRIEVRVGTVATSDVGSRATGTCFRLISEGVSETRTPIIESALTDYHHSQNRFSSSSRVTPVHGNATVILLDKSR